MKPINNYYAITKYPEFVKEYNLEAILGEHLAASDNSTPVLEKYQFVGIDDQLIEKVLEFGYTHQAVYPDVHIHDMISRYHVTLTFVRKTPHDAVPTSSAVLMPTNQEGCGGYVDELDAMPVKDLLKYQLIDRKAKVLFVSDLDFTLTLAFATYSSQSHGLAGAWEGITSTRYAPAGPEGEFQYVGARRVQCKPALLASDGKWIASGLGSDLSGITKLWQDVFDSMPTSIWKYGIDPLALPPALLQDQRVIWFLCPWTSAEDSSLLFDFLRNLHKKISKLAADTQVCISNSSFESVPCIIDFLGHIQNDNPVVSFNTEEHDKPYTCLGAENTFTQGVMKYRNNNEPLFTLVFKVNV